ncbi:MAG TPA: hypothetical protein VFV47_11085 [Hyphomicrobiaceae bacterium]|nr:hypothetical protein [Hyphomicrobiaceae bacterium]
MISDRKLVFMAALAVPVLTAAAFFGDGLLSARGAEPYSPLQVQVAGMSAQHADALSDRTTSSGEGASGLAADSRPPSHATPSVAGVPDPSVGGTAELARLARDIHARVAGGAISCAEIQTDLLKVLGGAPESSPLWGWAMDRASICLRTAPTRRFSPDFLEQLAAMKPDHARVREQLGINAYEAGDMREAVYQLQPAAELTDRFVAWETLADARLALARELLRGGDAEAAGEQWTMAGQAARSALDRATPETLPVALHTLARAELEAGRAESAVAWADRALQAVAALPHAARQGIMIAELHVFVGQIYYRAGQRDAGIAYMDQGIGMAQSSRQIADLRRIRDSFLKANG